MLLFGEERLGGNLIITEACRILKNPSNECVSNLKWG